MSDFDLSDDCAILYQTFYDISSNREEISETFSECRELLVEAITVGRRDGTLSIYVNQLLPHLAAHAYDALTTDPDYFTVLIEALANTTRVAPSWRTLFGKKVQGVIEEVNEPSSVLEVALRVCTLKYCVQSRAIEGALKIIANCCAGNNINRRTVIHQDGIPTLLELIQHGANPNILVPTLYNVCDDYDEPALFLNSNNKALFDGESSAIGSLSNDPDLIDDMPHSLAIEQLAFAFRSNGNFTAFELLLSLTGKISNEVNVYLAELVHMATQAAVCGFEFVRNVEELNQTSWDWTFSIAGEKSSTTRLIVRLATENVECSIHMGYTVLNLLSQEAARSALLQTEDASVFDLLTITCASNLFDGETEEDEDAEMSVSELNTIRKTLLKILYQTSGEPSFALNERRALALIPICIRHTGLGLYSDQDGNTFWQPVVPDDREGCSFVLQAALVILAQLAASDTIRDQLFSYEKLISNLNLLFRSENHPDVLYPTITLVQRLALTSSNDDRPYLQDFLSSMQRLLTAKGLGLKVPFETVTAYRTAIRGRPDIISVVLQQDQRQSIMQDVFKLWGLSMEVSTKVEIGKFFLEVLRTLLPSLPKSNTSPLEVTVSVIFEFQQFLQASATQIAEIFVWLCLTGEPPPQRDHGWFGLAMLSVWPEAKSAMLEIIAEQQEFRDAITAASRLPASSAVRSNLALMVSKLRDPSIANDTCPEAAATLLTTVAIDLGLSQSDQS